MRPPPPRRSSPHASARRRYRATVALVLAVASVLTVAPAAAATAAPSYVALGDSFAAGVGAGAVVEDGTECHRSPRSYPARLAERAGLALTLAACAGAVTADVAEQQATLLSRSTRYVTLTVGGNDLGFSSVLTTCALPSWLGNCRAAVDRGLRILRTRLPERLDALLADVVRRAPRADVVLTGYPLLFGDADCNAATFFSAHDRRRLNAATTELNLTLQRRARAAGVGWASPVEEFRGHTWCAAEAWVNGLSRPHVNSFHPNRAGHAGYADVVGRTLLDPGAVAGPGRTSARYPAVVSAGGPGGVRVPDLSVPRAVTSRAGDAAGRPTSGPDR